MISMKHRIAVVVMLLTVSVAMQAQMRRDTRCLDFMGIPLEGSIDSMMVALKEKGFAEWGSSDDREDFYFRGDYYGIRAKLMVSTQLATRHVQSAYVTIGPYRTKDMLSRNYTYFSNKLEQLYGQATERGGAYYFMTDYGTVKLAEGRNANGTMEIVVFYMPSTPFYKDALIFGLKGHVQEVITENAVSENSMERFAQNGKMENPDITDRVYNAYGYLVQGKMLERQGMSVIDYEYDDRNRLVRRTLTNRLEAITYVNEYIYNDDDEILNLSQKVLDEKGECLMSVNMRNEYDAHDDEGNWTRNKMNIVYWEKGSQSQTSNVIQTRKIRYWDE